MTSRSTKASRLSFRSWLIEQILAIRWSAPPTATVTEIALHLGVQVSVLEEAQALAAERAKTRGRTPKPGKKRALFRYDYGDVYAHLPPEIERDWRAYLAVLGIKSAALLRSLVHHFLVAGGPRPTSIARSWCYRGQVIQMKESGTPQHRARITLGAETALIHYAELWGVKAMAVVRGLIIDLLEGRVTKLRIVAFGELWGDPDRYLHPEKFAR